jgi:hypothetical protein
MDFNGGRKGCPAPIHFSGTVLFRAPGKTERPVWGNVCNATEKKFQKAQRSFARPHSTWTLKLHPSSNQFAGKEASACCVPTQQGHAPPCKPGRTSPPTEVRLYSDSINLQGRKRLLAASPLNKDTLLPANPEPYRAGCAATRYGSLFKARSSHHEFALTASARCSMPRRSSRRFSCFWGVVRPMDSNNHTVAIRARASRANTPW